MNLPNIEKMKLKHCFVITICQTIKNWSPMDRQDGSVGKSVSCSSLALGIQSPEHHVKGEGRNLLQKVVPSLPHLVSNMRVHTHIYTHIHTHIHTVYSYTSRSNNFLFKKRLTIKCTDDTGWLLEISLLFVPTSFSLLRRVGKVWIGVRRIISVMDDCLRY